MKLPVKITRKYYKRGIVEYPEGVVKFESSTPGTYNIDIEKDGLYEIICVGGGGGGVRWRAGSWDDKAGGGSGGYSNLTQNLTKNSYNIAVGAGGGWTNSGGRYAGSGGTSSFANIVNATGGQGGYRLKSCSGGTGITQNGNGGTPSAAGASVYNGYGAGGYADRNGGSGYVKVTCFSEETIVPGTAEDYDFYEDVPEFQAVTNNNKLYAFDR